MPDEPHTPDPAPAAEAEPAEPTPAPHAFVVCLKKHRKGIIIAAVCLLVAGFLGWLYAYLRPDTWHYHTDEVAFRQLAKHVKPRFVLWDESEPAPATFNEPSDVHEAVIAPDGASMLFTRVSTNGDFNVYRSRWDGLLWGEPEPLRALNSPFHERGPAYSRDGRFLFFSTDRPGGPGGFDIWVSRWDGAEFAWPLPLTHMVNSPFDEASPSPSATDDKLYFCSKRPSAELTEAEESMTGKELRERYENSDYDLFEAAAIPAGVTNREVERALSMLYSLREGALEDEKVMAKLGGTTETEQAVDRAVDWLTANQETNGSWSISRHGGQAGHDVAATAFSLLTYLGRGEQHNRPGPYRKTVKAALDWLLGQQNELTGDLRGTARGSRGNMYDHGIAALALAEAYGVTKDENIYPAAQSAIDFIVDGQNAEDGGWRYNPGDAADLSVSGWMVMALKSAEMTGLHVPEETLAGVRKFLAATSGGKHGGQYSYQPNKGRGGGSDAMVATGYFCSQLMGLSPNTLRSFETAAHLRGHGVSDSDIYYAYYGTLSSYQNQGPLWRLWRDQLHEKLLATQAADGSWSSNNSHARSMGRSICTSLIALSLQAHYRYTPLYGLGYEPDLDRKRLSTANQDDLPPVPLYRRAKRLDHFNSSGNESAVAASAHGDFLYLASDRRGGLGGLDLYRFRISGKEPGSAEHLGPEINTEHDETAPAPGMFGFRLIFSSNRQQADAADYQLYRSTSRRVFRRHDYSHLPAVGWMWKMFRGRLLGLALALVLFIVFLRRCMGAQSPPAPALQSTETEEEKTDS